MTIIVVSLNSSVQFKKNITRYIFKSKGFLSKYRDNEGYSNDLRNYSIILYTSHYENLKTQRVV